MVAFEVLWGTVLADLGYLQAALEPVRVDEPMYRSSQTAEMFGGRCGLVL